MAQPRALDLAPSAVVQAAKTRGAAIEKSAVLQVVLLYASCGYSTRQILGVIRAKARKARVELRERTPAGRTVHDLRAAHGR
jgi:hypothetical protein